MIRWQQKDLYHAEGTIDGKLRYLVCKTHTMGTVFYTATYVPEGGARMHLGTGEDSDSSGMQRVCAEHERGLMR